MKFHPGSNREAGTAFIEFVITVPLLLIFSLEMFDLGNLLFHHSIVTQLAREGQRFGSISRKTGTELNTEIRNRVNFAYGVWQNQSSVIFVANTLAVTVTETPPNLGVRVQATYSGLFPPFRNFPVAATAIGAKL